MKIAVYSKDKNSEVIRITISYCQRWNCYPSMEQYSERDEMIDAIKSRSIDIAILIGDREVSDSIIEQSEKMGIVIKFIWLTPNYFEKLDLHYSAEKKREHSVLLVQKIERELEACGIPTVKESLCRVHFGSQ